MIAGAVSAALLALLGTQIEPSELLALATRISTGSLGLASDELSGFFSSDNKTWGVSAGLIAPDETTYQYLRGRPLAPDGWPLEPHHRLLVLAARALVSHYRLLVVVDPSPWVDARRKDLWRAALVRASVGRTVVWITDDEELADRADHAHELVEGALRSI